MQLLDAPGALPQLGHHPRERVSIVDIALAVGREDEDAHRVKRAGRAVRLSPTEYKLLRYLLLNPERVLSRRQILDHVWEYDFDGDASNVESYISFLRRKVDDVEPKLIQTVRGVGYVLRAEER